MTVQKRQDSPDARADARPMQCWWMVAGLVDYKLCDRDLDCEHCPFDEALHGGHLSDHAHGSRTVERQFPANTEARVSELTGASGFRFAGNIFYGPAHTWARVEEGGSVRAGLDDFGQFVLGRVYSVELPPAGAELRRGEECWRVTHKAGETPVESPVSGTVKQSNAKLTQRPSLLNRDPYGDGWAVLIEPTDLGECLKGSLYGEKARGWYGREAERLYQKVNELSGASPAGATMRDGGVLRNDFMSLLNAEQALRLIESFFPVAPARGRGLGRALAGKKGW